MWASAMQREYHTSRNTALFSCVTWNATSSYFLCPCSFQSERETGDRNYAIGYYLKEKKVSFAGYFVFYYITLSAFSEVRYLEKIYISSVYSDSDLYPCSAFLKMQIW